MEKHFVNNAFKSERLPQADKNITTLHQTLCENRGQQERGCHSEVLLYHKKTASLEQDLLVANRKIERQQVMSQETEKLNKKRRDKYLEACKTISSLEAKNLSLANREAYLEKKIRDIKQRFKEMEESNLDALQKVSGLEQSHYLLEIMRREAIVQVHKLETKNAELEATLKCSNRRERYRGIEKLTDSCVGGIRSSLIEVESTEELTECDRKPTDELTEEKRNLSVVDGEKEVIPERLENAQCDILEGERMYTELRQQVVGLKKKLNVRDNEVKLCKQMYDKERKDSQKEICKLEEAVFHWHTKCDQCLVKENSSNRESKELYIEDGHGACWECELHLRSCFNEIAERDITIAYLQKVNESHEDKLRQILNKYKDCNNSEYSFKKDVTAQRLSSVPDLYHELQILLAFYKKKSENANLELEKWKALAAEARLCREKEASLFESQLSIISKDYFSKYENCRLLLEKEKSKRIGLEGQVRTIIRKSEESEQCESKYLKYGHRGPHFRQLIDSLVKNNIDGSLTHEAIVTQRYKPGACRQEFDVSMADCEDPMDHSTGEHDVTETQIPVKHENTNEERDSGRENVVPMIDAEKETVVQNQERPVDSKRVVEQSVNAFTNGSNDCLNQEELASEESLRNEVEILSKKNKNLQACCEKLLKEREERLQVPAVSGQRSFEMAANCEDYKNEIQKLKREIEDGATRYKSLEQKYFDCKSENQKLEEQVRELRSRVLVFESEQRITERKSFGMASETNTQSLEVDQVHKNELQDVEDALNESFAAQEEKSIPEIPKDKPTGDPAVVEQEKTDKEEHSISSAGKNPGNIASLPRKFPSTTTAPIPFKLQTHSSPSHSSSRQRTRSVDHTATDRKNSVESDTSDSAPSGGVGSDGKMPRFLQKKLSSSHLDAFKPKPFRKQTSLSDDLHVFARPRKNSGDSKTESTGSASDSEPGQETASQFENIANSPTQQQNVHITPPQASLEGTDNNPLAESKSPLKEPPQTLPKPKKGSSEKAAFQSGFSKEEYYSSIRPAKANETIPPTDASPENPIGQKEIIDNSQGQESGQGELV